MALLKILEYPDPRLRTVAKPISGFGKTLQTQIDNMFETMYAAPGIGLAATQVDIHKQLFVLDVSEEKDELKTRYINIQLLCKSLWKTHQFDFDRDVANAISNHFWTTTNTIVVFSKPKTFLDGSYCDFLLANKILKYLVTKKNGE